MPSYCLRALLHAARLHGVVLTHEDLIPMHVIPFRPLPLGRPTRKTKGPAKKRRRNATSPRVEFFAAMDAANVDLKGFTADARPGIFAARCAAPSVSDHIRHGPTGRSRPSCCDRTPAAKETRGHDC